MKKDLTEEKLLELKFKKNYVTAEESGDVPYNYYTYELGSGECLISDTEDDVDENGFYTVTFLSLEGYYYHTFDQVDKLIKAIEKRL